MAIEVFAALFHFDQDVGLPDAVGEAGAAAVFAGFFDAELGRAAGLEQAVVPERLEEAVEEDLGLAFFVPLDVLAAPLGEALKSVAAVVAQAVSPGGWVGVCRAW